MKPEDFMKTEHEHATGVRILDPVAIKRIVSLLQLVMAHDHSNLAANTIVAVFGAHRRDEVILAVATGTVRTLLPDEIGLCDGCIQKAINAFEECTVLFKELLVEHKKAQ